MQPFSITGHHYHTQNPRTTSRASTDVYERRPLLSGAPPPQVYAHPLECASFSSRMLLQWVTPLMTLANQIPTQNGSDQRQAHSNNITIKRGLHQADVYELPSYARTESDANTLQRAWISSGSLLLAFLKLHGVEVLKLGLWYAIVQICDVVGPYVLFQELTVLQNQNQKNTDSTSTLIFWLGVLLVSRLLRAFLSTSVQVELQSLIRRLTAALQSLVVQKALRLSNAGNQKADTLYALDVTQLLHGVACLHELWAAPLRLALSLALMEKLIGVAPCVASLGIVIVALTVSQGLKQLQLYSLTRLRRTREDRQNSTKDMVHAMPAVKLHAWETAANARVNTTRERELAALWTFQMRGATEIAFNFAAPVLVTTVALAGGYYSSAHRFTTASAFATMALVRLMQTPLRTLAEAVLGARTAWRSLCNLSNFMDQDEVNPHAVSRRDSLGPVAKYDLQDVVIAVEDATLGWAINGPVVFQHLDLTVGVGEFLVVHGRPGSGKSSFLSALLGEMQARDGSNGSGGRVYVGGSVAYCPQQPWLERTLSVRDNVLFGLPFDRHKYQRILDACALTNTIALLPARDHTLIQEWLPTLGQQALVSLARACYSDADVYLLDEPLAHLHSKSTAREIFSRCLLGLLCNKTRVVVTTRAEFINSEFVDNAIRFEDGGRLVHTRDIYKLGGRNEKEEDDKNNEEEVEEKNWTCCSASGGDIASSCEVPCLLLHELLSIEQLSIENAVGATRNALTERPLRDYLSCETSAEAEWGEGDQLLKSIWAYALTIGGVRVALFVFVLLCFWHTLHLSSELFVAYWVRPSSHTSMATAQLIYISLALSGVLLVNVYALSIAMVAVKGARRAFLLLTSAFLHAPLVFFDAFGAGSGRIRSIRLSLARRRELERAFTGKDLTDLDTRLPLALSAMLALGASTLAALLTAVAVTRYFALLIVPVIYMYVRAAKLYLRPARDLFHLERRARQAARLHAAESLAGAHVVRAFGLAHVHRVLGHHFWLLDVAGRDSHLGLHIDQWLALRVQLYGAVMVGIVAASSFLMLRYTVSDGLLALALYEVLVVDGGALESLVRAWAWLSPVLSTAARIQAAVRGVEVITDSTAYSTAVARQTSSSFAAVPSEVNPSLSWPTKGDLRFDAVSFRDPAATVVDELTDMFEIGDGGAAPLALKCVSFRLQPGEKVAILESSAASSVSSIGRALLRVHELTAGRIVIDGVDVATLGFRTLRSRVACVSAAALTGVLYDGSVRTQLDPNGANIEDDRLWSVLRTVGLATNVATLDGPLPGASVLQKNPTMRFLLSLARALLSEPSVVALALNPVLVLPRENELQFRPEQFALDDATLKMLQRVLQEELRDATILILLPSATASPQYDQPQRASLLNAADRVLVVVDGEMAELRTSAEFVTPGLDPDQLESHADARGRLQLTDLAHPCEDDVAMALHEVEVLEHSVSGANSVKNDDDDVVDPADTDCAVEWCKIKM